MQLKKLGIAFVAILAIGVTMVATASADPLFLFGGQVGAVSEGKGTLSTAAQFFAITCEKAAGTVEAANDSATFKGEIEFKECTATGLGQASGIIKFKFKGLTCLWGTSETELKVCVYIEASENVHVEVPVIGLVDFLVGSSQACKLTPDGTSVTELDMLCEKTANGVGPLKEVKDLGTVLKPLIKVLEKHTGSETTGIIAALFKIKFANAGKIDCA